MKRRSFLKGLFSLPFITIPSLVLAKPSPIVLPKNKVRYLEVSARRSGKSLRMAKDIMYQIDAHNSKVYLITPFNHWVDIYSRLIPEKYWKNIKLLPEKDIDWSRLFYFDEPDLLPKSKQLTLSSGYYAGTPTTSNGFLKELAKYNKEYKRYKPYYYEKDPGFWKGELKNELSLEAYNREVFGKFS